MTIKHLFPDVSPSLDLNFAASRRLDPRITYSRASSGTYFDSTGLLKSAATNEARFDHDPTTGESLGLLVEEARTNLFGYSNLYAGWSVPSNVQSFAFDGTPGLDGASMASKMILKPGVSFPPTGFGAGIYRNAGEVVVPSTYSVYVKPAGYTAALIAIGIGQTTWGWAKFNLDGSNQAQVMRTQFGLSNPQVVPLANGWFRISLQVTYRSGFTVAPLANYASSTYTGDGTSGIYVWGAQLEENSTFPTSYIPTPATFTSRSTTATYYDANGTIQTAGINVARDNAYFPDENGVMRPAGLLLEAAGTNLHTYSEQFDNVAWPKSGASITADTATAPDGTSTADKLIASATNSTHFIYQPSVAVPAGAATSSVYVKAAGLTEINLYIYDGSAYKACLFNLSTGATTPDSGVSPKIEQLANGWYRISVNYVSTGGLNTIHFFLVSNGVSTFLGDGVSGIYIWGAQVEASPYATSYIPTTSSTVTRAADVSSSSTVTRAADVAQITGTNFSSWINPSEGTLFQSCISRAPTGGPGTSDAGIGAWLANGAYERIGFIRPVATTTLEAQVYNLSSLSAQFQFVSQWPQNSISKAALAYKQNDFAASANGLQTQTDTSGSVPAISKLDIGQMSDATYNRIGAGTFARITYYPVRLSDATLQTITL